MFELMDSHSEEAVIKVIGVGGGGSNAINHMFNQGIKGVDFVICNTDSQALENSAVPIKIQLGVSLTEGLGAGANPEVGEQAAIESTEEIKELAHLYEEIGSVQKANTFLNQLEKKIKLEKVKIKKDLKRLKSSKQRFT